MPSCRSAPISLDTWIAMRASVLPPTAGLGYFSCLNCPASPRLCGECGADIRGQRQRRDRLGYHTLCPDIGFECLPMRTQGVSPRCSPRSAPAASCHGRLLRPLPHSVDHHLPRRGHFVCCRPCHGLWCWDQSHPPQTCLAHGAVCRLPFPVHAAQFITSFHQDGPDTLHHSKLYPALERSMDGAVVSELLGQVIPLATAQHPINDAVAHQLVCGP